MVDGGQVEWLSKWFRTFAVFTVKKRPLSGMCIFLTLASKMGHASEAAYFLSR